MKKSLQIICAFDWKNTIFASLLKKSSFSNCESSSAGRARPCQGRGRGFESRLSLKALNRGFFFIRPGGGIGRHAGLKILWLRGRAGSIPAPGTERDTDDSGLSFFLAHFENGRSL